MPKVSLIENEFASPYATPEDLLLSPSFLGSEAFISSDLIVGLGILVWVAYLGFSHLSLLRFARPLFSS